MTRLTSIILCFFLGSGYWSQNASLVFKQQEKSIELKWYAQNLVFPKGVHIYRKTNETNWVKLTDSPVMPKAEKNTNTNLEIEFCNEIVKSGKPITGVPLLNALVSSFKYKETAIILGLYYKDENLTEKGPFYYKIVNAKNEEIIATSNAISLDTKYNVPLPDTFEVKIKKKQAKFYWTLDPLNYFGVNLYASINGTLTKINEHPIFSSELQDPEDSTLTFQYKHELEENTEYEFFIKSIGFFFDESEASEKVLIKVGDFTLPDQPMGLNYSQSGLNKVHLTWDAYQDKSADLISVMRGLNYDDLKPIKSFSVGEGIFKFTDAPEKPGDYYYAIAAVDENDNWNFSERIIVHVEDMTPAASPTNLTAIADSGIISLSWDAVQDRDLKGYVLFRTGADGKEFKPLQAEPITDTTYQFHTSIRTQSKMNFYVVSVDSSYNRSKPSDTVSISQKDYIAPQKPLIKNITVTDSSIVLYWIANTEKDLKEYTIFRKVKSDSIYKKMESLSGINLSYTDFKYESGTIYQYYIVATDSAGNESQRSNIFTIQSPLQEVKNVEGLEVKWKYKKKQQKLTLKWNVQPEHKSIVFENVNGRVVQKSGLTSATKMTILEVKESQEYWVKMYNETGIVAQSKKIMIKK